MFEGIFEKEESSFKITDTQLCELMKFQAYFQQEMNMKNDPVGVHPIYSSPKYSPLHPRHHVERTSDVMRRCLPNPSVSWFSIDLTVIFVSLVNHRPLLRCESKETPMPTLVYKLNWRSSVRITLQIQYLPCKIIISNHYLPGLLLVLQRYSLYI